MCDGPGDFVGRDVVSVCDGAGDSVGRDVSNVTFVVLLVVERIISFVWRKWKT